LTGLIHDLGKIMFLWGDAAIGQEGNTSDGKQWSLGGDTWVVGCRIPDNVVLPHWNICNPDRHDDRYNTLYGMYPPHCGLDRLCLAWGHDEYLYRMLIANTATTTTGGTSHNNNTDGGGMCTLPGEALDMIRYHSAYPLHDSKVTTNAYGHLLRLPQDEERLEWVRLFNQFDLYTKDDATIYTSHEIDEVLWPYYRTLLVKYGLGGKLKW
jgi:inositol oxygenase